MQKNYNENLVAGAAIRDDKGRRISKLFEASHPKMTVGYAKNLIMPDTPTEQEFNFRQSGGGVIEDGVAVIDKVKGNSVVWNQMAKVDNQTFNKNGITIVVLNNKATISGTATADITRDSFLSGGNIIMIPNHKYLNPMPRTIYVQGASGETYQGLSSYVILTFSKEQINNGKIAFAATSGETISMSFGIALYDLTQMFGAGNEPTTYEEFLSRKPTVADEYAYNEGTIVNNKVEGVKTTGINLWDEEWELGAYDKSTGEKIASSNQIRSKNMFACLPHASYYWRIPDKANGSYMGFCLFYDISGAFISMAPVGPSSFLTVTTPSNARFVAFDLREEYGITYNHDICINLSDPTINGQYFPYEKHELDLSWVKDIKDGEGVKLFEDGMKSAGTAFDEVAKGKAIKRIGVKVFDGTENFDKIGWSNEGFNAYGITSHLINARINYTDDSICNAKSSHYSFLPCGPKHYEACEQQDATKLNTFCFWPKYQSYSLLVSFATEEELKAHLVELYAAGTPLVVYYELAEPIEVEYDEKNLTYPVVAGGTEEAIASEPSSAFRADIGYGIDAVKTILDLKARVEALEGK